MHLDLHVHWPIYDIMSVFPIFIRNTCILHFCLEYKSVIDPSNLFCFPSPIRVHHHSPISIRDDYLSQTRIVNLEHEIMLFLKVCILFNVRHFQFTRHQSSTNNECLIKILDFFGIHNTIGATDSYSPRHSHKGN